MSILNHLYHQRGSVSRALGACLAILLLLIPSHALTEGTAPSGAEVPHILEDDARHTGGNVLAQDMFGEEGVGELLRTAASWLQSKLKNADDYLQVDDKSSKSSSDLLPLVFSPLPLGSITPASGSWLSRELETSVTGLAGNLHTFYEYIKDSPWIGGKSEYAPLNEGFPYWFNGAVALAYSVPSPAQSSGIKTASAIKALKDAVHEAANSVLDLQADDGWIGPEAGNGRLLWARFPLLLGLINLADANETWVKPVEDALKSFVLLMHDMLKDDYRGYKWHEGDGFSSGDTTWGRVRYADALIGLTWLYERSSESSKNTVQDRAMKKTIWECMVYLRKVSMSWNDWYVDGGYAQRNGADVPEDKSRVGGSLFPYMHGVNVGQGLKAPAVDRRQTKNESLVQTALNAVKWTFEYHGAASGTILADERVVGLDPWSGSELCTTVETMYSLTYLHQALGHAHFADLAELAAYNALPAALTPDHWAHQYMTQPNQPWSENLAATPFSTAGTRANVFGLEPQYPCCTVNHPQGWPKFLMASYSRTVGNDGKEGLVHAVLGPARVSTDLSMGMEGSINKVSVVCTTAYPFGDILRYSINADAAFEFSVRVPGWYEPETSSIGYSTMTNDSVITLPLHPSPTTSLQTLNLPAGTTTVTYILGSAIRTVARAHDAIAVYRGALLYALDITAHATSSSPRKFFDDNQAVDGAPQQARDYKMGNMTAWNYAIDPDSLRYVPGSDIEDERPSRKGSVFVPGSPELGSITGQACCVHWHLLDNATPGAPPQSEAGKRTCVGPVEEVKLVPYGSAKLHMAELPVMASGGK